MSEMKLHWSKMNGTLYDIYRSDRPGQPYNLVDITTPSDKDIEEYVFQRNIYVTNLSGAGTSNSINLAWECNEGGSPETFKIVPHDPTPTFSPAIDSIWMVDTLPIGALWLDNAGAQWDVPHLTGSSSLRVQATDGYVYPSFYNASEIDDRYCIIWTYIDPAHIPDSIMVTFLDGEWNHRAYWGKDLFPYGVEGTQSMYYMGTIPIPGCWTPLVIDKALLGVNSITGMGFGVYKEPVDGSPQTGTIYINCIAFSNQPVYVADQQHIPIHHFNICRRRFDQSSFTVVKESSGLSFTDDGVIDVFGYSTSGYRPNFTLQPQPSGNAIKIGWTVPSGIGTEYTYRVSAVDYNGQEYDPAEISVSISTQHGYVVIKGGPSSDYESLPILSTNYDNEFIHDSLESNTTYIYRLQTYNNNDELVSTYDTSAMTMAGSLLGYFILGQSPLA